MLAHFAAAGFQLAAAGLVLAALALLGRRDLGLAPRLGPMRGAFHQRHEARQRFGAVALLGAVFVGADDDLALEGEAAPGELGQARAHVLRQVRMTVEAEAQLDGGRDLVDVLSARAGGADEAFREVALVQSQSGRHGNHGPECNGWGLPIVHLVATGQTTRAVRDKPRWREDGMRATWIGMGLAAALGACAGGAVPGLMMAQPAPVSASSAHVMAALADQRRPEADVARDALRHPADVLAFAGVSPGWRVADIGPGGGYYTRLFAVAVGEGGRVYAVDRPGTAERPRPMAEIAPTYANVSHLTDGYQGWSVEEPLDAIFISQIYHDFHLPQLEIDVPRLNREMFAALRPGGVLVVIDHAAVEGSDVSVTNTLHRIDRGQVVRELTDAGFVLDGESEVLRNPEDDRSLRVFENDIRGRTDQFALRFRKPS